ncbi:hypothetical protein HAX54_048253 [Datura stramonium]|uniref:Uncharacterized protein n=1 Tax=Datura stramonium TaxID=4076 RepID=A0ABS8WJ44_DATST|nr:hypothetical protein [Datura stramonium]
MEWAWGNVFWSVTIILLTFLLFPPPPAEDHPAIIAGSRRPGSPCSAAHASTRQRATQDTNGSKTKVRSGGLAKARFSGDSLAGAASELFRNHDVAFAERNILAGSVTTSSKVEMGNDRAVMQTRSNVQGSSDEVKEMEKKPGFVSLSPTGITADADHTQSKFPWLAPECWLVECIKFRLSRIQCLSWSYAAIEDMQHVILSPGSADFSALYDDNIAIGMYSDDEGDFCVAPQE